MKKNETLQLKGIAILMMLWLHLFSNLDVTQSLCNYIYWFNGRPLAQVLQKLTSCCVAIYALLGGYGLTKKVLKQNSSTPGYYADRVFKLYSHYWCVLFLFIPFAVVYGAKPFLPNDGVLPLCYKYIVNITGIDYSFNGAWWFFLPYAIITFFAPRLILFLLNVKKRKWYSLLCFLFIVQCISYVASTKLNTMCNLHLMISSYGAIGGCVLHFFLSVIRVIVDVFFILFPFVCGICMAQSNVVAWLKIIKDTHNIKQWQIWVISIVLVFSRLFLGNSSLINTFYVIAFVLLFCLLNIPYDVRRFLCFMGNHSTNMWLIHYFFFGGYILASEIYSFRYPLLIYFVLILATLLSSYIVSFVHTLCMSVYARCKDCCQRNMNNTNP